MDGYTIKSPVHGLLTAFVRQDRDMALIDFMIGPFAENLMRSMTRTEIVQMARSRWSEIYVPQDYRIVKVRLVEEEAER